MEIKIKGEINPADILRDSSSMGRIEEKLILRFETMNTDHHIITEIEDEHINNNRKYQNEITHFQFSISFFMS